jgi:hypothetical protein
LGVGPIQGDMQAFAGTGQIAFSASPHSGDCDSDSCGDCAKPCIAPGMCGPACVSLGLASNVQGVTLYFYSHRVAPRPGWQLSSAELRTPTPPPRLSHYA